MKNTFTAVIFLLYAQLCYPMGWGDLSGTNEKGDFLKIYPAWEEGDQKGYSDGDLYFVLYYKGGLKKNGAPANKPVKYKYQRCKFKNSETNISVPIEFSCEKSGVSPMTGVTYKVEPNPKPGCGYDYKYICTQGCTESMAPKIMLHFPEGCFE